MQDLTGKVFGRLTVLSYWGLNRDKHHEWVCGCTCGVVKHVRQGSLLSGNTKSCGCLNIETHTRHGMIHHPLYKVWQHIIQRCTRPHDPYYKDYGGRGIMVCDDWLVASNFLQWAKPLWRKGLQIDRIDNNGGYNPDNCRFVTPETNINNKRPRYNITGRTGLSVRVDGFGVKIFSNRPPCNGKTLWLGTFPTKEEAIKARNEFIVKHNLPHKIQEYKGD